jgi:diacylglycerol kinase
VVRTEPNARIHLAAAGVAVFLGLVLSISRIEWTVILLCIGAVISAEIINTSLEKTVDLFSPDRNEKAQAIKDISAAAVLFVAFIALITGIIIFLPHIFSKS